jgi:ParB family transcriptional regulator, chromosome partitioning protein
MSRKNPFATLDIASITGEAMAPKPGYGMTGAAKTVVRSIEEMAENTKKLMDGETIVELDPHLLDASRIGDRLSGNDEEYEELKAAIKEHGQSTPILVRPNPSDTLRYIIVFGHRRARVARELGIKVKAIVKKLDDIASAIAQGQENSARSNLSFIERAYFSQNLLSQGLSKDVVKSALGIDDAMLSKMLGVIEAVPSQMLKALGASKKIGRDKWLSLRQLILNPAYLDVGLNFIAKPEFAGLPEEERFDVIHDYLKRYKVRSAAKTVRRDAIARSWTSADNGLSLVMNSKPRKVAIEVSNAEAKPFSDWLSTRLDRLYDEYRQSKTVGNGD